jgi:hypothetical protein
MVFLNFDLPPVLFAPIFALGDAMCQLDAELMRDKRGSGG